MATNPASTGKGAPKVSQQQASAQAQPTTEPKIRFTSIGQLALAEKQRVSDDHAAGKNNVTKHIQLSSYEAHIERVIALVEYAEPGYFQAHPDMLDKLFALDYFHGMFCKAGDGTTSCPKGEQHFSGNDDCRCAANYAQTYISKEVADRVPTKPISGLLEAAKKAKEEAELARYKQEQAHKQMIADKVAKTTAIMGELYTAKDREKVATGKTREIVCLWNGYDKESADKAKADLTALAAKYPTYGHLIKQACDSIPSGPEHVWTEKELNQHIGQALGFLSMYDKEYAKVLREGA